MAVNVVNESNFNEEVLGSKGLVLVDFFATWCGPCKMLSPIVEEISELNDVKVYKVDVDQSPKLCDTFHVTSMPTLILFKDGQKVLSSIGYKPKNSILEMINNNK